MKMLRHAAEQRLLVSANYVYEDGDSAQHRFFVLELNEDSEDQRVWAWQIAGPDHAAKPGCFWLGWLTEISLSDAPWDVPVDHQDSNRCFLRDRIDLSRSKQRTQG